MKEKEELIKAMLLGCLTGIMIGVIIIMLIGNWILNNLARLFI